MSGYSEVMRKHFLDPSNTGALEGAHGVGEAGNAACGDVLHVYVLLAGDGRLERTSFQAKACSAVIASASLTTEALSGLTLAEARDFDVDALIEAAGGVPRHKAHAPRVVARALAQALERAAEATP